MWLTLILRNWQLVLIALLSLALGASTIHGRLLTAERNLAQNSLSEYKATQAAMAESEKAMSDKVIEGIRNDFHAQTAAIEKNAFNNAKARFGACPALSSNFPDRVRSRDQIYNGEAGGAQGIDATSTEQVAVGRPFIEACASDAGMILLWQNWATHNALPISKE